MSGEKPPEGFEFFPVDRIEGLAVRGAAQWEAADGRKHGRIPGMVILSGSGSLATGEPFRFSVYTSGMIGSRSRAARRPSRRPRTS